MQDTDLPIVLEELPNFRLKNMKPLKKKDMDNNNEDQRYDIAKSFIKKLSKFLKNKDTNQDDIYILYDFEFNNLSKTVFSQAEWPSSDKIEAKFEIEIDYDTQLLYNELCYRHAFNKLQKNKDAFDFQLTQDSWDNYIEIFDSITSTDLNIPASWVWDIIDEFIYQFRVCSKLRYNTPEDNEQLKVLVEQAKTDKDFSYWNLETVIEQLNNIIEASEVLKGNDLVEGKSQFQNILGHFALVGLIRVYVITGEFEKAVEKIGLISYSSLFIYSKAVPSYLTLFFYAGTAYLMTQKYNESVNLFQAIVLFFHKYQKSLTKSFQYENMKQQYEKMQALLILSQNFYPTNLDDTIIKILEETTFNGNKNNQQEGQIAETLMQKKKKLENFDVQTFQEVYSYGFPRAFSIIKNQEDFLKIQNKDSELQSNTWKDKLEKEFQNIKNLNEISNILKIYSNIKLSKVAKLLNVTESQLQVYLEAYKNRSQSAIRQNVPFEQTILFRFLLNSQGQTDFVIENQSILVTEKASSKNYAEYYTTLNQKLLSMEQDLQKI